MIEVKQIDYRGNIPVAMTVYQEYDAYKLGNTYYRKTKFRVDERIDENTFKVTTILEPITKALVKIG
jgi:hypothetical protein